MLEVQQYAVCDFELYADVGDKNPFAVEVTATFTHELGGVVEDLPGFLMGISGLSVLVRVQKVFGRGVLGLSFRAWMGLSGLYNVWGMRTLMCMG